MSATITSGRVRGPMARIYDRLRKRSQRAAVNDTPFIDMAGRAYDEYNTGEVWWKSDHIAYLAGVRDALNAVSSAREDA